MRLRSSAKHVSFLKVVAVLLLVEREITQSVAFIYKSLLLQNELICSYLASITFKLNNKSVPRENDDRGNQIICIFSLFF